MEDICKKIEKDVAKSKVFGKGTQGVLYDLGTYVIKVSKGTVNAEILKRVSDAGVSPRIHGIYVCNGLSYVLMDKLTHSFKISKYGNQIARLVTQMIQAGVFHNDIHAENLMAKDGRLYFIDFDNATLIPGMTKKEFDDAFKYHTSYTDETYSKRIKTPFLKSQLSAIEAVRNSLK